MVTLDLSLSLSSSWGSTGQAGGGGLVRNAEGNWVNGFHKAIGQVMPGK